MGKIQNLTQEQQSVLDEVKKSSYFQSNFYFTGGTALSSIYLRHRYSEDLDFFSENRFDNKLIFNLVKDLSEVVNCKFTDNLTEIVYIFVLTFTNNIKIKLDFGFYPYKQIKKPETLEGIKVDSLLDIAVNKLFTTQTRCEVKDFVDLYFLLQEFSIWDLMEGRNKKFRAKIEPLTVAADFLKVERFDFLPQMIKPLTLDKLKTFFREKAKQLGLSAVDK